MKNKLTMNKTKFQSAKPFTSPSIINSENKTHQHVNLNDEIHHIMKSTSQFAETILNETEKQFKTIGKEISQPHFNPLDNIKSLYSSSLNHIESMIGQLIMKLIINKSPLLQYVQNFYSKFKSFLIIISNIKINLNISASETNFTIALFDSTQIMDALTNLYELAGKNAAYVAPEINNVVNNMHDAGKKISNHSYVSSIVGYVQHLFMKYYDFIMNNIKFIQTKYHLPIQNLLKLLSNIINMFASYYLKQSGLNIDINAVFQEIVGLLQPATENHESEKEITKDHHENETSNKHTTNDTHHEHNETTHKDNNDEIIKEDEFDIKVKLDNYLKPTEIDFSYNHIIKPSNIDNMNYTENPMSGVSVNFHKYKKGKFGK
jgi:hypothetical protein